MLKSFDGKVPRIAESAFLSETACIIGDVEIGENSSVWPGAVIRGDLGKIRIGNGCSIEDNCVIHSGSPGLPSGDVYIGDRVIVGHGAVVNCRQIGSHVLIGMNSSVLHEAEIGDCCIIAAGCVVGQGMKVPAYSFVAGVPGAIKGKATEEQLWWTREGPQDYISLAKRYKEQGL
jgi:carbonic anhydrase/acetyltransferase-like protein (isoleucine patch superfamily)